MKKGKEDKFIKKWISNVDIKSLSEDEIESYKKRLRKACIIRMILSVILIILGILLLLWRS